jgi:hypothetical protein
MQSSLDAFNGSEEDSQAPLMANLDQQLKLLKRELKTKDDKIARLTEHAVMMGSHMDRLKGEVSGRFHVGCLLCTNASAHGSGATGSAVVFAEVGSDCGQLTPACCSLSFLAATSVRAPCLATRLLSPAGTQHFATVRFCTLRSMTQLPGLPCSLLLAVACFLGTVVLHTCELQLLSSGVCS